MLEKKITESFGKRLLFDHLSDIVISPRCISVDKNTDLNGLQDSHPWLLEENVVVKVDQGIKRRGKQELLRLDVTYDDAKGWIENNIMRTREVEQESYILKQFMIEPYVHHDVTSELYVAIYSELEHDIILFNRNGGVDIEDVDLTADHVAVPLNEDVTDDAIQKMLHNVPENNMMKVGNFIRRLFETYRELHFTFLEINPFVLVGEKILVLDVAAQLDPRAQKLCGHKWGEVDWVKSVGRDPYPKESELKNMAIGTPSSLEVTVLNKKGRIWCALGGGGTSLLIGDTALQMGCIDELGCYAQFCGGTTSEMMYSFFKTILDFMLEVPDPRGKVLVTGSQGTDFIDNIRGGIKNGPNHTTNCDTNMPIRRTFGSCSEASPQNYRRWLQAQSMGVVKALQEYKEKMVEHKISIYFRVTIRQLTEKDDQIPDELQKLGIPVYIFSAEVPIRDIIDYALGNKTIEDNVNRHRDYRKVHSLKERQLTQPRDEEDKIFNQHTEMVVVNMFEFAIRGLIGFDFICGRDKPSVSAIVRPNCDTTQEIYKWGKDEVWIPVYKSIKEALHAQPGISVVGNFAHGPLAYSVARAAICSPQIKCVLMMVGHLPVNQTRELILLAREKGVMMIGPTVPKHSLQVSVLKPGSLRCSKLGSSGGPMRDIQSLNMTHPGSVVLLSRSGGLAMNLYTSIARNSDGLYLALCIGGGRYTGTDFMDHILQLQDISRVRCFILIGEVGGLEEYKVCLALKSGHITKPIIAFCCGTSATHFQLEPAFFGHTGGGTDVEKELAAVKNLALAEAGATVAEVFDDIPVKLAELYDRFALEDNMAMSKVTINVSRNQKAELSRLG